MKETHNYSEHFHRAMRQSTYVLGAEVEDESRSYLSCPACGERRRDIPQGKQVKCERCDLVMERWGNALVIWREHVINDKSS